MAFRILDDNLSNVASISSSDTSAVTVDSSETIAEWAASCDEEMDHTVDPSQFEPVASDSNEHLYLVDNKEDSPASERLLNKDCRSH